MKIGVLGGTFDPVHLAHIRMAEEARDRLGLDRVILVPAGGPTFKLDRPITPSGHRVRMLRLAVKGRPGLAVATIEIERPGPSYTIDTITALRKKYGPGAEIYFMLGCDSLAQLPEWREPARLVTMCRLVAVPRPGCQQPDMKVLEKKIPGITGSVIYLEKPYLDISATAVREMTGRGEPIDHLVPKAVADYINKHNLYIYAGGKS